METRNGKKMLAEVGQRGYSRLLLSICLALCVMIGGFAVALSVITNHPARAHAASISFSSTTDQPWGLALDGKGNLWVAEPNCPGNPNCGLTGAAPPGIISEYNASTLAKINDFVPPAPASYNPMFVAPDGNGNIWFTDPTHNAIGELIPASNTWNEYTLTGVGGATAIPVDLTFDAKGHLWYADFGSSAIGLFDTVHHTDQEMATPTPKTTPYGITVAPDGVTVWFTENSLAAVGNFTAPAGGTLPAKINEFPFAGVPGTTPHLITTDNKGNAWFSTGFGGQVGEVVAGTKTVNVFCVSQGLGGPHISGIGVDNTTGRVWFDDSLNQRIGYLTPSQYNNDCASANSLAGVTYTTLTGVNAPHPHDGLVVDGKGDVFFSEEFGMQLGLVPAGVALPPPGQLYPPGPTAKTWYFAEGRVGAGFEEFLTIANPDPTNSCIVNITYLLETGAPVTVQRTIAQASRSTESVNADLGTPANGGIGRSVSAIVQDAANSPCIGVVVERPMYFNFHGDQSGTDVMGATHTAKTFYFADVPSGSGFSSFITILNPPGGTAANVTVNYFANGKQVGTQSVTVAPGARGTLSPNALGNLPMHVAAVVTSSQPVVVERPTYFLGIDGGFAGSVTGASSVIGAQALQGEYFFAEGYAGQSSSGGRTQENLVIANLGTTTSAVTISLEYINGTKHSFNLSIAPNNQVIWNVNVQGTGAASNEVSADVAGTGGGLVVSRQLYFSYVHTLARGVLNATGGTEVTGLPAGQISKSYSFAEGYSNNGYNEWLTLQNPTGATETIYISMINGYGRGFTLAVQVGANTRATVDITAQVLANLVRPGDDHRGYEVSMTVQTLNGANFVVERPMYINTSGSAFPTMGGTDVFGYNGN
jgi:streptogramin lyase